MRSRCCTSLSPEAVWLERRTTVYQSSPCSLPRRPPMLGSEGMPGRVGEQQRASVVDHDQGVIKALEREVEQPLARMSLSRSCSVPGQVPWPYRGSP